MLSLSVRSNFLPRFMLQIVRFYFCYNSARCFACERPSFDRYWSLLWFLFLLSFFLSLYGHAITTSKWNLFFDISQTLARHLAWNKKCFSLAASNAAFTWITFQLLMNILYEIFFLLSAIFVNWTTTDTDYYIYWAIPY